MDSSPHVNSNAIVGGAAIQPLEGSSPPNDGRLWSSRPGYPSYDSDATLNGHGTDQASDYTISESSTPCTEYAPLLHNSKTATGYGTTDSPFIPSDCISLSDVENRSATPCQAQIPTPLPMKQLAVLLIGQLPEPGKLILDVPCVLTSSANEGPSH